MTKKAIAVGMDIGTTHVRAVIGEFLASGAVNVIGVGTSPSRGLKRGVIVDLDETSSAVRAAVEEAERMAGLEFSSAFLGIVGSQVGIINNRGIVAVSGDNKEITEEDIERVMQAARVIALPPEREIIDVLPRQFIVDGFDGIKNPIGMMGVRLEVDAMLVWGASTSTRNALRCVNRAGLEVDGLVLNSLAAAEILLSPDEKELGVFLVDIGGGTAEVSVFQGGNLMCMSVIPVGGDYITHDLAVGLKTTLEQAEKLKINHGAAFLHQADREERIRVHNVTGKGDRMISQADLAAIMEPRILEMLQLVKEEIGKLGFPEPLPAGVVLTGGVSLTKGIVELAEDIFDCSVRTAQPGYMGVKSPIYSTAVGMIHYAQRSFMITQPKNSPVKAVRGLWSRIRLWFQDFFE